MGRRVHSKQQARSIFRRTLIVLLACAALLALFVPRANAQAPTIPASIPELARALGNDPDRIFDFVYQNIKYVPMYGSHKGGLGTLIDRAGSAHDQATLLRELFAAAGYQARYEHGTVRIPQSTATAWLNVTSATNARLLLSAGGVNAQSTSTDVTFPHVWVAVQIGGTWFHYDPAIKPTTINASGLGLTAIANAAQYSLTNLLTAARSGATISSTSVQNLNRTALRDYLVTSANNLAASFRQNQFASDFRFVMGGQQVPQVLPQQLPQMPPPVADNRIVRKRSSHTYLVQSLASWINLAAMPTSEKAQLRVRLRHANTGTSPNILDRTFNADEIYDKRVTVFWEGRVPILYVDGIEQQRGAAAPQANSSAFLALVFTHPYAGQNQDADANDGALRQAIAVSVPALITNFWGPSNREMVEFRKARLAEARRAGLGDSSEAVLGESMATLSALWWASLSASERIIEASNGSRIIAHHAGGAMVMTDSPFIDLQFIKQGVFASSLSANQGAGYAWGYLSSAFESAIFRQLQGVDAASTMKLLDLAVQQGEPIYNATGSNWTTTIRPLLVGYAQSDITRLNTLLPSQATNRVVLPRNGSLSVGGYQGSGWLQISSDGQDVTYRIKSTLGGGFSSQPISRPSFNSSSISRVQSPLFTGRQGNGISLKSFDPINMFTGDYTLDRADISVGSSPFPYGLALQSSYSSGARHEDRGMGWGWTHNFDIRATKDSDIFQSLGEDSPIDAAAAIIALRAMVDVLSDTTRPVDRIVIGTLIAQWVIDVLTDNIVTVSMPGESHQFVRLTDGTFNPPPAIAATLTVNAGDGTYRYRSKNGDQLAFNTDGRIVSWQNAAGAAVNYSYSGTQLTSVANSYGRTLNFEYNNNRLMRVTDASGRRADYLYDAAGNQTGFQNATSHITNYQYDQPGRMTKLIYPASGTFVTNVYDSLSRVRTQTDGLNNTWEYFFAGWRSEEKDPLGRTRSWIFTDDGKELRERDQVDHETAYSYDGRGRRTLMITPRFLQAFYVYDNQHNVTRTTTQAAIIPMPGDGTPTPPNIVTTAVYEPNFGKMTSQTDALGRVTNYTYDPSNGNLLSVTRPSVAGQAVTRQFTYYNLGLLDTITDEEGMVTKHNYDGGPNLVSVIVDAGRQNLVTQFGYDAVGNVTSITDPLLRVTTQTYDSMRRLSQVTAPAPFSFITRFFYDADGNQNRVERQTGNPASPWQISRTDYNAAQKPIRETDPKEQQTIYFYDALNRVQAVRDPQSRTTTFVFDPVGRVSQVFNNAGGLETEYTYTVDGLRASLKDARGHITNYIYDRFSRLLQLTYPNASTERYSYDANGNVLTRTNRGGVVTTLTYDVLNRVRTKAAGSLPTVTYTYDRTGRQMQVSNSGGALTFNYDTAGRLIQAGRSDGRNVAYQWDAAGNRTRVTWPDGFYVTYEYDELNRILRMRENGAAAIAQFTHDALSRRTQVVYGNTARVSYSYEPNDNVALIAHDFAGSVATFGYGYSAANQITSQTISAAPYAYKPPGALGSTSTLNFGLANNVNQYSTIEAANVTYSTAGNLTGWTSSTRPYSFTYDAENRLTNATVGGANVQYTYDALGRRASRQGPQGTENFLYDGDQEIAAYSSGGSLTTRTVMAPGIDQPILEINGGGRAYYHQNLQGSVVALSDANGAAASVFAYDPWGIGNAGTTPAAYRFTGRRFDPDTQLYYMRARDYFPAIGRFLQTDPIGYDGGQNLYTYVGNDPLNATDPSGMVVETAWDVANLAIGAVSFSSNVRSGNWGWAAVDAVGVVYDLTATAVPFLPAGASAGIKALKMGNSFGTAFAVGKDTAVVADIAHRVTSVAPTLANAGAQGTRYHTEIGQALAANNGLSWQARNAFSGSARALGGPDISWRGTDMWLDVTTKGQWKRHTDLYDVEFGPGSVPLLYRAGQGIGGPRLRSGAGIGLTAAQQSLK